MGNWEIFETAKPYEPSNIYTLWGRKRLLH